MKKTSIHIITMAWVLLFAFGGFTACSDDDAPTSITDNEGDQGDSGYEGLTVEIVEDENEQTSTLPSGSSFGVFVFADNNYAVALANAHLIMGGGTISRADASSGFSLSEGIGICAYSPYSEVWDEVDVTEALPFSIASNQRTQSAYEANDLLVAPFTYINNGKATLSFRHVMAKVSVCVIDETGKYNLSQSEVELPEQPSGIKVNLISGKTEAVDNETLAVSAFMGNSNADTLRAMAILPPATIVAGRTVFTFEINGQPFSYAAPQTEEWESGKDHIYEMKLTENGLIPTGNRVIDWESGNEDTELTVK